MYRKFALSEEELNAVVGGAGGSAKYAVGDYVLYMTVAGGNQQVGKIEGVSKGTGNENSYVIHMTVEGYTYSPSTIPSFDYKDGRTVTVTESLIVGVYYGAYL